MRASVELIIPGLFNLPIHELESVFLDRELPALNYILRYAAQVNNQVYDFEPVLAKSLGLSGCQYLPLVHGFMENSSSGDAAHLLCRAVHLKPDMNNAVVLPLDNSNETTDDIVKLINDLNDIFNVNCYIRAVSNRLYVIQLKQCEAPDDYPHYLSVLGRNANLYMEQSKQRLPWYQLINEIQMFMHAHEINQKRFEKGLLAINSLWCWGGGQLPELSSKNVHWYTCDESLKRFADKLGIPHGELDAVGDDDIPNHTVCIDLSFLESLKSVRDKNLKSLLSRMEQQLLVPLIHRVKSKRCDLRLWASYRYDFVLSPYSAFQFWKQSQSLHHFSAE